jgi:O-antigen/teichoic acid export membrane protein
MSGYEPERGSSWALTGLVLSMLSGLVGGLICVGAALVQASPIREALLVMSPSVMTTSLGLAAAGFLAVRGKVAIIEGLLLLQTLLQYGISIGLALSGTATVVRVAWVWTAASVLTTVPQLVVFFRSLQAGRRIDPGMPRKLFAFSLPVVLQSVSWTALQRSDVMLLGLFRGTAAVGLYQPVLRIVEVAGTAFGVIGSYYIPAASRMLGQGRIDELRRTYIALTKWSMALISPLLAIYLVGVGPLLVRLFGPEFAHMEMVARVLAIGYVLQIVTGFNGSTLIALGRTREITIRAIAMIVLNVGITASLIPPFGLIGAATGTTLIFGIVNVANSYLAWKTARVHPVAKDSLIVAGAIVLAHLVSYAATRLGMSRFPLQPLGIVAIVSVAGVASAWFTRTDADRELGLAFRRAER